MTKREFQRARKRIWEDMGGCECTRTIVVDGKAVMLGRDEMCTRDAIRCNGRANRWVADRKKLLAEAKKAGLDVAALVQSASEEPPK